MLKNLVSSAPWSSSRRASMSLLFGGGGNSGNICGVVGVPPSLSLARCFGAASPAAAQGEPRDDDREVVTFLKLNNLRDIPGAVKKKRRVGRGVGSSKGKTCGRGHKGQKARSGGSIPPTFEGGQTPLYKRLPKRGFTNKNHATPMLPLNLGTLQDHICMGRIDPNKVITLRDIQLAGIYKASKIKHGIKLLAYGKERLKQPLQIRVSRASSQAVEAVEGMGGEVTTVHYNKLALRSVLRPEKFDVPIKHARPPPKLQPYYTNWEKRGYLNPAVQMRDWFNRLKEKKAGDGDDAASDLEKKFQELLEKKAEN